MNQLSALWEKPSGSAKPALQRRLSPIRPLNWCMSQALAGNILLPWVKAANPAVSGCGYDRRAAVNLPPARDEALREAIGVVAGACRRAVDSGRDVAVVA